MGYFPTGDRGQASAAQIYNWAVAAGFNPAAAVVMTAITYPESGGHPGIVQSGQPYATTGWGLTQITPGNSVPSVGVNEQLLDGATNLRAAFVKYSAAGNSFRPWTTYTSGAYRGYLAQAASGQATAGGPSGDNAKGPITGGPGTAAGSALGSGLGPGASLGGPIGGGRVGISGGVITGGPGDIDTIIGGNLPDWMRNTWSALGSIPEGFTYTFNWLQQPIAELETLFKGLIWLVNPANWVRVIAGIIGSVLAIGGALLIATAA